MNISKSIVIIRSQFNKIHNALILINWHVLLIKYKTICTSVSMIFQKSNNKMELQLPSMWGSVCAASFRKFDLRIQDFYKGDRFTRVHVQSGNLVFISKNILSHSCGVQKCLEIQTQTNRQNLWIFSRVIIIKYLIRFIAYRINRQGERKKRDTNTVSTGFIFWVLKKGWALRFVHSVVSFVSEKHSLYTNNI